MPQHTNAQIMTALRSDSALNRARAQFSAGAAGIEQEGNQRRPAGPIEIRGMEFDAVLRIAAALGCDVDKLAREAGLSEEAATA